MRKIKVLEYEIDGHTCGTYHHGDESYHVAVAKIRLSNGEEVEYHERIWSGVNHRESLCAFYRDTLFYAYQPSSRRILERFHRAISNYIKQVKKTKVGKWLRKNDIMSKELEPKEALVAKELLELIA